MAVDETLLDRYAAETERGGPPTVRLYGWSPAAVSLGRKQPLPTTLTPRALRDRGIDLVRRPTGGRAVLHQGEWTYSVAGRIGSSPFPSGGLDTYRRIAEALVAALEDLGVRAVARDGGADPGPLDPRACFEVASAHEILLEGEKVVGSAQARRRRGFLQHGSIPFAAHGGRPDAVFGREEGVGASALGAALGGMPTEPRMVAALRAGFAKRFGVDLDRCELTAAEALRVASLRCWKYDTAAWTIDGRCGERERRWGPSLLDSRG